ncbi:hypothetical protein LSUB1_G006963 [Lachnellula subtilissima]|uniref:Uncharacterized protein n=1 Tax=Lachnellula subtilissima TaxID=602034 RepID=A0A8H8U7F3_9HELO|nr:hypothetical protein LSUB1_G006963 [Lachnellula subtilissima]
MDPRQPPQHPFSRNTASPYGRTPFPPSANQPPFPPSSHPPTATPTYAEHQRRPSEPPYYTPQRSYGQEGPSIGGPGHSRHQSASSIGGRNMPPPSSPQSQHHSYGPPPPQPRGPPVSVGPASAFPSGRDLPTLPPIGGRLQTTGMSISSMLGGPPSTREQPPSQYGSPVVTSAGQVFPGATHASPRMSAASDYAPFRRPQTPEHRPYEPRDNRANSAGSPPGMGTYSTPEARSRFGTPGRPQGMPIAEERREPIRVPNPNAIPPRPSSQPNYNAPGAPPQRRVENPRNPPYQEGIFGRRPDIDQRSHQDARLVDREKERDRQLLIDLEREREHRDRERERELREREQRERERERVEPAYQRAGYEDRHTAYGYAERERQEREREREVAIQRELEIRERELRERERVIAEHAVQQDYAHQLAQRNYNRPPEPREQPSWMRPEPPRTSYEQPPERPPPQQERPPNGYEYPASAAPQYRDHPAYAPSEPRYAAVPHPTSAPPQHSAVSAPPFETYLEREQRAQAQLHQQQQQQQQSIFGGLSQNGQYQAQDSPRRRDLDDPQQMQRSRSLLGVQEINRKGRVSPLPQAVQGAQGQMGGPGGEPGIKSEFGRMFSGIGNGVSAMGIPSPVTAGPPPLSFSGQLHREDVENLPGQDSPMENGGNKQVRSASRGGGSSRRRKLKEEDIGGDDSSTGRRTPSIRGGKRSKAHHHHHHHHHHHADNTSSPVQTPLKNTIKASSVIPSPPDQENRTPILHHHHIPASRVPHHHHHHHKPSSPKPTIPLPIRKIKNDAVLASVADKPRRHLGHAYYSSELAPTSSNSASNASSRGFVSTANPLPKFEGKENCTFTVKIGAMYLQDTARRDITYRRAVWGTDIYTDDSDVLCACIHSGYVQGCFNPDIGDEVGLKMLLGEDCVLPPIGELISEPPKTGPSLVPEGKELHVTVLILPALLDFMVTGVKWVSGSSAQNAKPNSKNNTIMPEQLSQQELEEEAIFARLFNGGPVNGSADVEVPESNVRSEVRVSRSGDITGIGMGSWWKKAARMETAQGRERGKKDVRNGNGNGKSKERSVDILAEAAASLLPLETTTSTSTSITPQTIVERITETVVENDNAGESDAGGDRGEEHVKKEGVSENGSGVAA